MAQACETRSGATWPSRFPARLVSESTSHLPGDRVAKTSQFSAGGNCFGWVACLEAFGTIILAQTHYIGATSIPRHRHQSPGFFFALRGAFEINRLSEGFRVSCGEGIFHSAEEVHSLRVLARNACAFHVELFGSSASSFAGIHTQTLIRASRIPIFLVQLHQELMKRDEGAILAVQGLVLQLAAELARVSRPAPADPPIWLRRAEQFLSENLVGRFNLEQLALAAGAEAREIVKAFKQFFNRTPAEHLRAKRIEVAREQLFRTSKPIARVAAETGFYDQAHFCHQFRKATGYSPRQYRELPGISEV